MYSIRTVSFKRTKSNLWNISIYKKINVLYNDLAIMQFSYVTNFHKIFGTYKLFT